MPARAADYERHWTPVHLDIIVDKIEVALSRAEAAGAAVEQAVRTEVGQDCGAR